MSRVDGVRTVWVDGEQVDLVDLANAWRARGDVDKVRGELSRVRDAYKTSYDKVAVDLNTVQSETRKARAQISRERDMYTGIVKERDAAIKERDDARVFLEARTRERDTASECLRDISEERLSWRASEREAHASRDRLDKELIEMTRERDALQERLSDMDKRQTAQVDRLVKERAEARAERDDATRDREEWRAGKKWFWLVRRTDAAGKPGEYGNVIVRAATGDDALDTVMASGYNGQPMYGYRDRDHAYATRLDRAFTGVNPDDQVVVAQTLR
jgi:hypothetical protein